MDLDGLVPSLFLSVLVIHARPLTPTINGFIVGVRGHMREFHGAGEPGNEARS